MPDEPESDERELMFVGPHSDSAIALGEAIVIGLNLKSLVVFFSVDDGAYYNPDVRDD